MKKKPKDNKERSYRIIIFLLAFLIEFSCITSLFTIFYWLYSAHANEFNERIK